MLINSFNQKLYLVISELDCKGKDMFWVVEQAIKGGVDIIQLREKEASHQEFTSKALRLKQLTDYYQIPLIINDNLSIAQTLNVSGIHVGNKDIAPTQIRELWEAPSKIVGYSIEYLEQLKTQQAEVSDYLAISPVFNTDTKKDTITQWGLEGVERIRDLTAKPLIAIGNMQLNNIRSVINAGADCIAVVSAICSSENPQKSAYNLKNEIIR